MTSALQNLRAAWHELRLARDAVQRTQTYRRGSFGAIGYGGRKQSANVSDSVDFAAQHIENAMKLIEQAATEVKVKK